MSLLGMDEQFIKHLNRIALFYVTLRDGVTVH